MHPLLAWAFAVVFAFLGLWVIALNVAVFYLQFTRRRQRSWIPLLGGFLLFLGMAACPLPTVRRLAWLPFILDPGCIFGLLFSIVMLIYMIIAPRRAASAETTSTADEGVTR
jgi:hypothetical protein